MTLCLLLIGAPGSGKGTQASIISKKKKLVKLSTGDLIRDEVKNGTELGSRLGPLIGTGNLVDDETMLGLVKTFFKGEDMESGIVSDGFPRNLNQAMDFNQFFPLNAKTIEIKVIYLKIRVQDLVGRIVNRRICIECNEIFNVSDSYTIGLKECVQCGGELILRDDDNEAIVRKRHSIFEGTINRMLAFYGDNVTIIDATLNRNEVTRLILEELDK
ncbi:nucleoside monophosphate kinase [bacterium]|jgi:adenylate kinase|nr:nucleoside monophosphate kinase [bacterium]